MTASDITGQQDSFIRQVVIDAPPLPGFSYSPANPVARHAVTFNASGSRDPDGAIVSYRWSFGDGSRGLGASPRHAYGHGGRFTAALTVTDNLGVAVSSSQMITVAPLPRVATSFERRSVLVVVNEAGTITVGSMHRRLAGAGSATFKLGFSAAQRRRLKAGLAVKVNLKITFAPRVGPRLTKSVTLNVRP